MDKRCKYVPKRIGTNSYITFFFFFLFFTCTCDVGERGLAFKYILIKKKKKEFFIYQKIACVCLKIRSLLEFQCTISWRWVFFICWHWNNNNNKNIIFIFYIIIPSLVACFFLWKIIQHAKQIKIIEIKNIIPINIASVILFL